MLKFSLGHPTHFCNAFICVLQLPRIPGKSLIFSSGGGYALCLMLSPVTPSTYSSLMFDIAAERDIASRRSVRKGRLSTKIFWNCDCVRVLCCLIHVAVLHESLKLRAQLANILRALCSGYPSSFHPSGTRTNLQVWALGALQH
jgi:hypothetical protein